MYPEGIAVTRNEKRFFVTSTTDGTVFRGSVRGRSASVFLPGDEDGRTTAIGIKTMGDRLYVAGGTTGSVFIYDVSSRELVRRVDTGAGGFINDLAVMRNGDIYVTDSKRPNLYRIPAAASESVEAIPYPDFDATPTAFNANGIVRVDNRTLVFVNSGNGRLYRLDTRTERITTVDLGGRTLTNGDGMEPAGPDALRRTHPAGADRQGAPLAQRSRRACGVAEHRPDVPLPDHARHRTWPAAGRQLAVRPSQRRRGSGPAVHGQQRPAPLNA